MASASSSGQPIEPPRPYAHEVKDFRRASVVAIGLGLLAIGIGLQREAQVAVEGGLALAGFALVFRLVVELVPSTHDKVAFLHPRNFFLATWRELDAEAEAERRARTDSGRYDYRPMIALVVGAVCLALMEYFGHTVHFNELVDATDSELRESPYFQLMGFGWWSLFRVLGYFVVPALVAIAVFREPLREHGLETKGFLEHAWIYALSFVVVFLCVAVLARNDAHFQSYYPFYRLSSRSWADFWMWEVLYAAQFFSLEFFFRGFWLRSMKPSMGSYAIFAMVVPYCMIHFGKPLLETLAAIFAGLVLGTLSMKTRSIWSGFLIHVSVAISMDMAALLATDGLPTEMWP
ncbi:MAG: CPBP family intramembrane metalloprotease [Deltaproteobacteria bacterium]|nr:CPBP family intramembrane metalloprotease [Deltaproteobacteria bacterium]